METEEGRINPQIFRAGFLSTPINRLFKARASFFGEKPLVLDRQGKEVMAVKYYVFLKFNVCVNPNISESSVMMLVPCPPLALRLATEREKRRHCLAMVRMDLMYITPHARYQDS